MSFCILDNSNISILSGIKLIISQFSNTNSIFLIQNSFSNEWQPKSTIRILRNRSRYFITNELYSHKTTNFYLFVIVYLTISFREISKRRKSQILITTSSYNVLIVGILEKIKPIVIQQEKVAERASLQNFRARLTSRWATFGGAKHTIPPMTTGKAHPLSLPTTKRLNNF